MNEQVVDVGDETQVKKRKNKTQLERERQIEEIRQLLKSEGGRYFLWRLLKYCKIYNSTSGLDAHHMAIASGLRDAGLWVLGEIEETDLKVLALIQAEGTERDRKQGVEN